MSKKSKDSSIFIFVEVAEDDSCSIIDCNSSSVKLDFLRGWDNGIDDGDVGRVVVLVLVLVMWSWLWLRLWLRLLCSILACGWKFQSVMSLKLLHIVGFRRWRFIWGKALPAGEVLLVADPSWLLQLLLDIEELSPFPHRSRSFRSLRFCSVSLEIGMIGDAAATSRWWWYSNVLLLLPSPPTFFPASWETKGSSPVTATTEEGNDCNGGDDVGRVIVGVDDDEAEAEDDDQDGEEDPGSIDPFLSTSSQFVNETEGQLPPELGGATVWWWFCWCCIDCDEVKDVWRDGGRDRVVATTNDDLALSGTTSMERFVGSIDISVRRPARNFPCDIIYLLAWRWNWPRSTVVVVVVVSFWNCDRIVLLFVVDGNNEKKSRRQLNSIASSEHKQSKKYDVVWSKFYKQTAGREYSRVQKVLCSALHYSIRECLWRLLLQ